MSVINEIESVEAFIKTVNPAAATYKQAAPKKTAANTYLICVQSGERELETGASYRIDREYQIVYFAQRPDTVLAEMDTLADALFDTNVIDRYIRVAGFTYGAPFLTENDLYASIGVLQTETRRTRTDKSADDPLINEVITKITVTTKEAN